MSHSTPATLLTWAILSTLLCIFLVHHLYCYDRFKCLRWNNANTGAFKRIMTYTYLITVPLTMVYSYGFTTIKYSVGWTSIDGVVMPTPYELWPTKYQNAVLPLYLVFSIAWSLELVTHLEELCFWLFLVNAGRVQQGWFRSPYFKIWILGSVVALVYMPLVTIFTRHDPLKCEAFTFLFGSIGSLCLTLWFLPILYMFPKFLDNIRSEGVDRNTLMRLIKFHEMNIIRIAFRFVFTVPFIILGADGVRPHHHVNNSFFWGELLTSLAAIGIIVSSGITLTIFFPRSIEKEYALKHSTHSKNSIQLRTRPRAPEVVDISAQQQATKSFASDSHFGGDDARSIDPGSPMSKNPASLDNDVESFLPTVTFAPNRRMSTGVTMQGQVRMLRPSTSRESMRMAGVHPFVQNFTSPIDFVDDER